VHNGGTVGYLAVAPLPSEQSDAGRAFIAQQSTFVVATGLVGLVLALAMSTLLARRWLAPVRHLTDGAHQVAAGRFDTQVPAQGDDELALLARTFNDMARRLGDAETSRQRWLSDVAHELRTPIAAARAEIEALQDGVRGFDRATADRLHQQVMRLNRLVDDLRLSMDSATGLPAMHWSVADPVDLLLQAAALAEPSFAQAGLRIALAKLQAVEGKAAPRVRVDAERLQQVFANLLNNSVRYTDPGGVLELNAEVQDGKTLVIRFDDSAPAPTSEDMPRLFERLYRGESSRNRALGGSGLGLAICKAIIEAHAGTITAEPSPLGGLRITVRLPLLAT
jgi:two-component system sensor histidine kinase BaeS